MKNYLVFIILSLWGAGALAVPTSTIWIPNDETQQDHIWRFDCQVFFSLDKRPSDMTSQPSTLDEGVTYGLFDTGAVDSEMGFDWWEPESQDNLKSFHAHFKVAVKESGNFPSFVFGAYAFGFKPDTTDEDILYVGTGKTFNVLGHVFFGLFSGNPGVLVDNSGNPASKGLMLSLATPIPALSKKFSVIFDFQSSNSIVGAANLGGSWMLSKDATLTVGYDSYINHYLSRDTATVEVNLNL